MFLYIFSYMATSGIDRTLKIWDLRTYKAMQTYKLGACAGQLAFSQTGLLAAGVGNIVQVRVFHFMESLWLLLYFYIV